MLPGGLTTITVTDSYSDITGNPLGGSVTFTASCRLADGNVVFPIQPVTVPVNQATGTFTVTLPCTDNSGLSPAGQWAYRVMIDVQGMDSYPFTVLLPSTLGTSVQLSAVAPSPPFAAPSGMAVYSVNGQTGAVELTASEAGAVPLSGGTMTGPLILSGDPTQALGAATKEYVDNSAGGGTTIDGVTVTGTVASGRTIIATSTSAATWQLPLQVDTTSSDIQPLGSSAVAGNLTQAAAANHVHANTGLVTSGESAGGDLSGTFPASLTVAKIQGTAISSPPGGTSTFLAGNGTWQMPPGAETLTPTAVKTSAYPASPGDFVPVNTTSGAVTVTLPNAPANGTIIGVKLAVLGTGNAITIARNGSGTDVFNVSGGSTSLSLSRLFQTVIVLYQSGIWYVTSTDPAISLDATSGDIAALGSQAAGSIGKAADAGHVHPTTGLVLSSSLPLALASGGTGSVTAAAARTALGAGAALNTGDQINAASSTYGADPTGAADSTTAINNALSAAVSGQEVYLPAGTYKTSAPLTPPQGVVLRGASGGFAIPIGNYGVGGLPVSGTIIKPSASFSGAAVILLTVSGAVQSGQQQILQVSIDGSSLPSSTIHGIQGINGVAGVKIRDVLVYGGNGTMKGNALDVRPGSNASPDFWDVSHCHFSGVAGAGVNLNGLADSYFFAVESTGNTGSGWTITNGNNSRFVGCKGEGSGSNQGWFLTANSGFTGQMSFSNCTASSNHLDGFYLTGPGAGVYTFTGCRSNNDGAGGGSSAGLTVTGSFAGTVQLTGLATVPGGSSNPPNGLRISSASSSAQILLANCAIWGYTTSVSNDSSAGTYRTNSSCVFMTGTLTSPTATAPGLAIAAGGTGATAQQAAINALTGTQSAGTYLRSNGMNASLSAIQAADLPAASASTQGAIKVGAGGYCLVVAASGATTAVKNSADYVCTGTGDQSTINTAIGALPGAGGTILLSAGTFNITGSINIAASNITLEGTGVSTKIQVTAGTNITAAVSVSGTGTVEAKLRRFWINGTIADTSGDGILISTPWSTTDTQHTLEDLYITGCPNNGVHVATSADTRVMLFNRIHVKGCNGNGFYFAYPSCTDSVFTDCIADTVALNGFFIGGANCWFENCKAFYCGSGGTGNYGFYVVGYSNYFSGCQAQDNYYDGFFGDNTGDATYGSFGCTFVNCSGDANGQSAGSSGLRGHGVQQWQVTGGLWMTRPYETSWTQAYGITWEDATAGPSGLRPSSGNSVTGALFRNNATGTIHDTSAGPNYALGNTYASGTPSNSLAGPLAMGSSKITGLANGTASSDAAAFGQLPSSSSPLAITSGGTGQTTAAAALTALGGAAALVPLGSPVTASTVTAAAGQFIQCDTTSNAITVTLPASGAADKSLVGVKMITQGSTSGVPYTVTVSCASGDHFNVASTGGTSLTLSVASQGVLLQYDHALAVWYVLADDIPLGQADIRYGATAGTIGAATGTENLTLSTAATWNVTLAGNTTFAFQGPASPSVQSLTVYVTQAASGGPYSVTWPGSVTWFGGTAPAIATSAAGALTVVTLQTINGGTSWYGGIVSNAALPLPVGDGGTGLNALAAYGLVAGGAGTTSPVQQIGTGSLGQVLTSNGSGALPSFQVTSTPPIWEPADSGLVAWNYDPCITNGGSQVLATAGTLYVMAMKVAATTSVTNIYLDLTANGSGLTHGYAGLWQGAGGALLGVTSDQATSWGSGSTNAAPAMAITGGPVTVTAGVVYVGVWFTGTTGPTFYKTAAQNFVNVGLLAASSRWGTANTGLTTAAPSTLGTIAASEYAYWAAVG